MKKYHIVPIALFVVIFLVIPLNEIQKGVTFFNINPKSAKRD